MKDLLERVNESIGARIYGNPTGLITNIFARLALLRARSFHPGDARGLSIPEEPYISLDYQYSEEVIEDLRNVVDEALTTDEATEREKGGEVIQRTITSNDYAFHEHFDMERIFPDEVKSQIENYFGSYFAVERIRAFESFHIPDDEKKDYSSTYNWHIDYHAPSTVQLFIPLTEVTEEHGPTEIVDESPLKFSREDRGVEFYTDISPDNIVKMTSDAGEPYLFNPSRRLHRSGLVEEGKMRCLIFLRLVPSSEPLEDNWTEKSPYTDSTAFMAAGFGQFKDLWF